MSSMVACVKSLSKITTHWKTRTKSDVTMGAESQGGPRGYPSKFVSDRFCHFSNNFCLSTQISRITSICPATNFPMTFFQSFTHNFLSIAKPGPLPQNRAPRQHRAYPPELPIIGHGCNSGEDQCPVKVHVWIEIELFLVEDWIFSTSCAVRTGVVSEFVVDRLNVRDAYVLLVLDPTGSFSNDLSEVFKDWNNRKLHWRVQFRRHKVSAAYAHN